MYAPTNRPRPLLPIPRTGVALAAALLALAVPGPLAAEIRPHEAGQVDLWLPEGFTAEMDEDVLIALDREKELTVLFWLVNIRERSAAREILDTELSRILQKMVADGRATAETIGGLEALLQEGSGEIEGTAVRWGLAAIVTPASKTMLVLGVMEERKREKHEGTLRRILKAVRPHAAPAPAPGDGAPTP